MFPLEYPVLQSTQLKGCRRVLLALAVLLSALPPLSRGRPLPWTDWESEQDLLLLSQSDPRNASTSQGARWINPCDLPGHYFDPETDLENVPRLDLARELQNLEGAALRAHKHFGGVLEHYKNTKFRGGNFIEGASSHRLAWVPKLDLNKLNELELQELLRKLYSDLQLNAVNLEQIVTDEVLYGGDFLEPYRDAEDVLTQLLCKFQITMYRLGVRQDADVQRDIMDKQYRNIDKESMRSIRNYVVSSNYLLTLGVVSRALHDYAARTLYTTTYSYSSS